MPSQQIQQQAGSLLPPAHFQRPPPPQPTFTAPVPRPPLFGQAQPTAPPPSAVQSYPMASQFPGPSRPQFPRPMLSHHASSSSASPGPSGLGGGYGAAPANYGGKLRVETFNGVI